MKLKSLFAAALATVSVAAMAQTHLEGVEYYKADQFENAGELLERNYNNAGTDQAVAQYYLGLIDLGNSNLESARKHFEQGIAINPNYGYNYVGLGEIALRNKDLKGAEKLFKEGEGKTKKDAAMSVAIARAYYNADATAYSKEIEKRMEKARRQNLNAPEVYIFEGDRFVDNKDWGQAAAQYDMAASTNPTATEAYVKYANLFTQVNPSFAIRMLTQLLANVPGSALGQRELANAYYNNNNFEKAAKEYGKYVKNPNHFKQDEDRYAFLLFYGGDYNKGYDYASKLLADNPSNFTARRYQFMNAAQIAEQKDNLLAMATELYDIHKRDTKNNTFAPIDYTLVADEFQRGGQNDKALEVIKEAIKDMPDNANFNKQLALLYVDRNEFANASEAFGGYMAKVGEPGFNDYIQDALFAYYGAIESKDDAAKSSKLYQQVLDDAAKASEIIPDNYRPYKIMGDVAIQRAAKEDVSFAAINEYTKAAELLEGKVEPRYVSDAKAIYNYLGNSFLDKKNTPEAKVWFLKVVELEPNNVEYRKFVEGLK